MPKDRPVAGVPAGAHLFCDDAMLAETRNVWRSLHHPLKHAANPVMEPDRPWEGYLVLQPGSVVFAEREGRFKMWYNALPSRDKPDVGRNLCYAVSADGVNWEKPEVGLVEHGGSTANNIVLRGVEWTHCVLKDDAADDPEARWKLLYWGRRAPGAEAGINAAFSPDGIRWRVPEQNPVVPRLATGDTFSAMRDPASGQYWLYHKTPGQPIRTVSRMVSDDFVNWRDSRLVLAPDAFDPPDTQFYGLSAFPRAGQCLGFLWVYHTYPQTMDVQMVSSRDGLAWERVADRKLLIHLVPTNHYRGGGFDSMMIYPASAPVEKDGRLWLYYSGFTVPHNALSEDHDGRIGVATLRRDGFCSLDATSPGHAVTRPLVWRGDRLLVNAEAFGLGRDASIGPMAEAVGPLGVRAQVEDKDGRPAPGFAMDQCVPLSGDCVDAPVCWKGAARLSRLNGQVVRLRFELAYARLYSWSAAQASAAKCPATASGPCAVVTDLL